MRGKARAVLQQSLAAICNDIALKQLPAERVIARHVAKLFGDTIVAGLEWEVSILQFRSYAAGTERILDVSGSFRRQGRKRRWHLLVKCLRRPPDLRSAHGWDREILACERLWPRLLSATSIRIPKFLGTDRTSANSARLWLEYVEGKPAAAWSLSDWRSLAAGLALLQAGFVEDGGILSESWLNRDDLRCWIEVDRARLFPVRISSARRRAVAPFVSPDILSAVMKIWRRRHRILKRLDELPQTLCHNDVWAGNVLYESGIRLGACRRPVLLDWQLVGPGPVGGDLAFAIAASTWLMLLPLSKIEKLERTLISGYLAGLTRAGRADLTPTTREVFVLTAALRYTLMLPQLLADVSDRSRLDEVCLRAESDADQVLHQRALLIRRGVQWAVTSGLI